jgi:hypothetical protein
MEINKENLEFLLGKEILDFKVGITKNGITEVKVVPKSQVQEIEVTIYVNNERIDGDIS